MHTQPTFVNPDAGLSIHPPVCLSFVIDCLEHLSNNNQETKISLERHIRRLRPLGDLIFSLYFAGERRKHDLFKSPNFSHFADAREVGLEGVDGLGGGGGGRHSARGMQNRGFVALGLRYP